VPARLSEVEALERRTAIGHGEATIHTVEHLLAAAAAHEIDDLLVELSGPEPPILDGSVAPYFTALHEARPVTVDGEPTLLTVRAPFTVVEGDASYIVAPSKTYQLTVTIEFPHPLIGRQVGSYQISPESFARELAPARTFGFTSEVAGLQAKGLIKGASTASAIVLDERGVVNGGTLRWPDEFVRHKAADIVGDLALTGARVRAHVVATRPSHAGNIALARALARAAQRSGVPAMDIGRIMDVLPHRYPFLLVDRILEIEGDRRIVGVKNVTINEPFFQGHFPAYPVMPGVLVIEAMAQVAGLLTMLSDVARRDGTQLVLFAGIDEARFKRQVVPGDTLLLEAHLERAVRGIGRFRTKAMVDDDIVCEAKLLAAIRDVPPTPPLPV